MGAPVGFLELLEAVTEESDPEHARRSTVAARKDAHRKTLESFDLDRLLELQEKMRRAVDVMTANQLDHEPGILSAEQARVLMEEIIDQTDIRELLEVRREMIKAAVFAHISEECRREGAHDPDHVNGSIPVPALGKRFAREACGRTPPRLDEEKFRQLLGSRWEQAYRAHIVPEQVIAEHVEYTLDSDKILAMAEQDPAMLEVVRECLIPGEYRTPRMAIRDL